jgi:hypothetical protein
MEKVQDEPEETKQAVERLIAKYTEIKEIAVDLEGWKESSSKDGFTIYTKKSDTGLNCVRGQGTMDFSAKRSFEFITTEGNTPKYDDSYIEGETIQWLDQEGTRLNIGYSKYKGGTLISNRDFVMIGVELTEDDGSYTLCYTSCEHKDKPDAKKTVRAELYIGGWRITPDKDDPENKCQVVYMSQMNPKGSIPKYFVNKTSDSQGSTPRKINECLKKE